MHTMEELTRACSTEPAPSRLVMIQSSISVPIYANKMVNYTHYRDSGMLTMIATCINISVVDLPTKTLCNSPLTILSW